MGLRIVIKPLAEIDIDEAVKWYAIENEKLAENFLLELCNGIQTVSKAALGFRKRYKQIRAFALKKFPYNIYYIVESETMFVVAVLHQKRNPKIWKKRN